MKTLFLYILLFGFLSFYGCTPEVGSDAWCEHLKSKPKGEWTANEAKDYARYCIF